MANVTHQYEAMFLFGQSAAQDLEAATSQVRQIVERHEGQVLVLKKWDERKLAYEIKKQKRGTYVICYYRGPGGSVAAIERDVNLSDNILRVLVTDADHLNQQEMAAVEPQPIIREERPSWERPSGEERPRREDRPPRAPRREEAAEPAGAEKE
jgi:small subunit ribosomal protein S6